MTQQTTRMGEDAAQTHRRSGGWRGWGAANLHSAWGEDDVLMVSRADDFPSAMSAAGQCNQHPSRGAKTHASVHRSVWGSLFRNLL